MKIENKISRQLLFKFLGTASFPFNKRLSPDRAVERAIVKRAYSAKIEGCLNDIELLRSDYWNWQRFWPDVISKCRTVEGLYSAVSNRLRKIEKIKEKFRPFIQDLKRNNPFYERLAECASILSDKGTYYLENSCVLPIKDGVSGSYILTDQKGEAKFVIKPIDEEAGCLHNPKGYATPFKTSPLRSHFLLYDASREVASYQIARCIGVDSIAPKTILAIVQSDQFHDLSDDVSVSENSRFRKNCGEATKEKLCSVQEYIPNSKTLTEVLQELQAAGLSDEEISKRFDPDDFEDANLFLWATYETDGHSGNFLVYVKGIDSIGNEIFGLKKIDNGYALPEKNQQFRNHLKYMPNAKFPLSDRTKAKIEAIDTEALADQMRAYGLESAIPAMRERISLLKDCAKNPGITIKELNTLIERAKK